MSKELNSFKRMLFILLGHIKGNLKRLPFLLFILVLSHPAATAQNRETRPVKAFWVIRDRLTTKQSVREVVETAKKHGFNHIFAQVRGRGDAYYNSEIVVRSPFVKGRNFDPLRVLINQAHKENIKVHAWVNVYLLWSSEKKPVSENHLLNQHPEWTARAYGDVIDAKKNRRQFKLQGSEGVYLSPGHPQVKKYLLAVFGELIDEYEIDGLHLDYVRYPGPEYGFNRAAMNSFRDETGVDPELFIESGAEISEVMGKASVEAFERQWKNFKLRSISNLVIALKERIKASGKPILLTAAVKPNPVSAREQNYQNWVRWVMSGTLDYAVPMNYNADLTQFMNNLESILTLVPADKLIMGIGAFNQNHFDVESKIYKSKSRGIEDFIFFSYNEILKEEEYVKAIQRALE